MTPTPTLHDLVLIFPSPGQFRRVCSAPRTVLQTSARLPRHRSATVRVRAAWTAEWGWCRTHTMERSGSRKISPKQPHAG